MKFPEKTQATTDGQAAWALLYGLMNVLRSKGLLTDDDVREAVREAQSVAPSRHNVPKDDEAKEMLADMAKSIKGKGGR